MLCLNSASVMETGIVTLIFGVPPLGALGEVDGTEGDTLLLPEPDDRPGDDGVLPPTPLLPPGDFGPIATG
jgi:hypothetical protein